MHTFLRAVGFSNYKSRKQLEKVYRAILNSPSRKIVTSISVDTSLIQFEKDFGDSIGLCLIGEYDINSSLSIEHCFPYVKADLYMHFDRIFMDKKTDSESYMAACDDYYLDEPVVFYLQNIADYAKSKWFNYSNRDFTEVKFSALSVKGTVILGVSNEIRQPSFGSIIKNINRNQAKNPETEDVETLETLALNQIENASLITNRILTEDLLTIVDTSLIPTGFEFDHYMIVGTIVKVETVINRLTNEQLYKLLVEANDFLISVCINSIDLQGEPKEGRRFRGEIWLQGHVKI